MTRRRRPSERRGGGVSSIFSVCPENVEPNDGNQVCVVRGGAPVTQSCCFTADLPAIRNAPIVPFIHPLSNNHEEGKAALSGSEEPVPVRHQCENEGDG